jgi:hypothetical protein
MQPRPLAEPFTSLDWIGVVVAAFSALVLAMFPLAGEAFAVMLKDFGSADDLPVLTRLATSTWFPMALAFPVIAALLTGVRGRGPIARRRAWIVAAFVLGCAGFAVCLVGVYLPVFALAGAVGAE